jgi:hypothetical protein
VKDEIAREEEYIAAAIGDEDEQPLDFNDFQKRFQNKLQMTAGGGNTSSVNNLK